MPSSPPPLQHVPLLLVHRSAAGSHRNPWVLLLPPQPTPTQPLLCSKLWGDLPTHPHQPQPRPLLCSKLWGDLHDSETGRLRLMTGDGLLDARSEHGAAQQLLEAVYGRGLVRRQVRPRPGPGPSAATSHACTA